MMRGTRSKGKNAFRAPRIAIDVEGDALAQEGEIDGMAFGVKIISREAAKGGMELLVMAEDIPITAKHFVEETVDTVVCQ